jgi:hypothetical protein
MSRDRFQDHPRGVDVTNWMKRVRGAIGIGLTWGAAWLGAGLIFMVIAAPHPENPFFVAWGILGFIAGVTFATILGIVERRRLIDQLSLPRIAGWGALGGLALAGIFAGGVTGQFWLLGPLFALAGAGCAAGTLGLARRGDQRRFLDATADLSEAALSSDPRRKLP